MSEGTFVFPASFAQQRLWFLDQLQPGNPVYNIAASVRLTGRLNVDALRFSTQEIVRRHESLRTTFGNDGGLPVQIINASVRALLTVVNLEGASENDLEADFRRRAHAEAEQPFDLTQGPLVRTTLLRASDEVHYLLVTMHHIVSDGWSLWVYVKELTTLYAAHSAGRPSPLLELSIQYADFAHWQQQWLQAEVLARQLGYWREQLAGAPASLDLPADRVRPAVQSFKGERLTLLLSETLTEALKALSRREGATLFMTLLAAFKVVLQRQAGRDDIVVGTPIAGRNRVETEALIGFFLNTLVLRTSLAGNPSFRELLGRVREVSLGAYAHQDLPFEKLLEELKPERSLSRSPLFQVFFNMLNFPNRSIQLPDLVAEIILPPPAESKFDLTMYIEEQFNRIQLELVYSTDLFERDHMGEMLEQLNHLLTQIAENPEQPIDSLSLVTPRAATNLPNPTEPLEVEWLGGLPEQFAAQAQRLPEQLAVIDSRETWTYKELDARANQLAHCLIALGVRPQDQVAIYAHRSAPLVWALLGTLKAGAAFVILDPAYPVARLLDYLNMAQPCAFIQITSAGALPAALEELVSALSRIALPARANAEAHEFLAEYSTGDPAIACGPDDLAYIAFTSGSTGRPKGILGRHGPLVHFAPWVKRTFGLTEAERFSMLSGLSHDPLQRDIFTPLQLGATICIPDQEDIISPGRLGEWFRQAEISVADLTPAMGRLVAESLPEEETGCVLPALRYAFFVGDALTKRDVARLRKRAPLVTCVNLYGATETQRAVSYFIVPGAAESLHDDVPATDGQENEILPLGRGIKDVQLLVLNRSQRLSGISEPGEIYFRSPHLATGYLDDEALTQERFITNPFTGSTEDRLYRTGDLGRYLADGNVGSIGRADKQVKVRGFRVELGEIESALVLHPAVEEAVVTLHRDERGEHCLVAYIVGAARVGLIEPGLRRHLAQRLPDYMLPASFVNLERMPLTPNGKLDRHALPAPAARDRGGDHLAPRTPMEELLAGLFAEVLGVERVGVEDNFFELGGHSLLATQMVARARRELGARLEVREVFEAGTVAALALAWERRRTGAACGEGDAEAVLAPVERAGGLPLSFAQQRLWFLEQLTPGTYAYNIPAFVRLTGQLDQGALRASLDAVVARHEALRTTFALEGEAPVQHIHAPLPLPLTVEDLRTLEEPRRTQAVEAAARQAAEEPFALDQWPLLRARLLRVGEEEHVLLLVMHHIISDGWSLGVLVRELRTLYAARVGGEGAAEAPLPELPVQYADYAVWQRGWLRGEELARQISFWRRQLAGAPAVMELQIKRPRAEVQNARGASHLLTIPHELCQELKVLSRREGVTLFMTLLTAFKLLLHHHTAQHDIVVGTDVANRHRVELEGLIGLFVNQLVLRTSLAGDPSVHELLRRVRETTLDAHAHQDLPFEKLAEVLKPERSLKYSPLFQVKIVQHTAPLTDVVLPGLTISPVRMENKIAQHDLLLILTELPAGLDVHFNYDPELLDVETVERMGRQFEVVLRHIVNHLEVRISEVVELLTQQDREETDRLARALSEANRRKLRTVRRQRVGEAPSSLVKTSYLTHDAGLPLVVQPLTNDVDLIEWAGRNRSFIETNLLKHGAILFRGFRQELSDTFERFAHTQCPELFAENGEHPRKVISGKVYTPVFYPPEQKLLWHNENTFNHRWPMKIWFGCLRPAAHGGETPLVDSRRVYERLDPRLKQRFMEKKVMYVRNYGDALGLDWQTVLQAADRPAAEQHCRDALMNFEWKPGNRLRTEAVRPATARHPRTGETVWFNQAQHWHPSCLDPATRAALAALYSEEDMPRHCYYGDGTLIEDSVMEAICEVYRELEVSFPWQQGDIVLLDNMLTAHARNPFVGERRLLVAMGEMITENDLPVL